ncbi:MAG: Os1348 family NHLP clan protein [Anaerolineaceae bacterium]|nr:Os1348 family NHLP clan protein [Anaerolineaceae bacterium]
MSQEKMIEIIKKAIADAGFRARLAKDPEEILKDYDLSPQDIETIRQGLGGEALDTLSAMLDRRVSRARLPVDDLLDAFDGIAQDAHEILSEPGSIAEPSGSEIAVSTPLPTPGAPSTIADDLTPFTERESGGFGNTYDPGKQYVGVQLEHGEVLMDDDWNEPPAESKLEGLNDDDVIDRPEHVEGEFASISPFDDQTSSEPGDAASDDVNLGLQMEIDHSDQEERSLSSISDEDDQNSTQDNLVNNIK